jgi:hypothetical protein
MSEDPTQITFRTILEAINSLGVELHNFRAAIEKRFEKLDATMNERFDDLDDRINVLAGDIVTLRAREVATKRIKEQLERLLPGSQDPGKDPEKKRA